MVVVCPRPLGPHTPPVCGIMYEEFLQDLVAELKRSGVTDLYQILACTSLIKVFCFSRVYCTHC